MPEPVVGDGRPAGHNYTRARAIGPVGMADGSVFFPRAVGKIIMVARIAIRARDLCDKIRWSASIPNRAADTKRRRSQRDGAGGGEKL
jgi:hypothetical protein